MSKLYLVPTPIGNLGDITLRAVEVLESVDIILAEDTRKSSILLRHLTISKKVWSYHSFNEHRNVGNICDAIEAGEMAALITDAGTPGISDPGFLLVREAVNRNIPVESLPGPTAFIPALTESGIPCDRFCFEGFLPNKKGKTKKLTLMAEEVRTMVFYESPYRLNATLALMSELFGPERRASVSRELTKIHGETVRGTLSELHAHFTLNKPKGEIVIVVAGATKRI